MKREIYLNDVDKIKVFVDLATKCRGEVDLVSGRYMVDGKSIMGIFSLDLSKPVFLHLVGMDEEEERAFLEQLWELDYLVD